MPARSVAFEGIRRSAGGRSGGIGCDLAGGAGASALEHHVLEEVGQPLLILGVVGSSVLDPDAERHGANRLDPLPRHTQTVGPLPRPDVIVEAGTPPNGLPRRASPGQATSCRRSSRLASRA